LPTRERISPANSPLRKLARGAIAFFLAGLASDKGKVDLLGQGFELIHIFTNNQNAMARLLRQQIFDYIELEGVFGRDAKLIASSCGGIIDLPFFGLRNANFGKQVGRIKCKMGKALATTFNKGFWRL
jgi:hypothetical protein